HAADPFVAFDAHVFVCSLRSREWGMGNGEWGVGNGMWERSFYHSPLPIPNSRSSRIADGNLRKTDALVARAERQTRRGGAGDAAIAGGHVRIRIGNHGGAAAVGLLADADVQRQVA